MYTNLQHTVVLLPDETPLEVTYYCSDNRLSHLEKKIKTLLYIQLHDCICTMKILKNALKQRGMLETLVQNKVVYEKGHLC